MKHSLGCLILAFCVVDAGSHPADQPQLVTGDYLDSPVFYEVYAPPAFLAVNRTLLRENRLQLRYFPPVDVSGWDWNTGGIDDFSWWIQVEELRFLLPLIRSDDPADLQLAIEWFSSWYDSDKSGHSGHRARWRYPMSAAYRALVLVYLLKTVGVRDDRDTGVVAMLREAILEHQEYLADARNFEGDNNHGLVQSFALLELCRVFPDEQYRETALQRMLRITRASVSPEGVHTEHSPGYHFAFAGWLDDFTNYLSGIPGFEAGQLDALERFADRMRNAAWFLHDADGTIPEIGDTDSLNVFVKYPRYAVPERAGRAPALYDTEAGFAFYKSDGRYVVFSIQTGRPVMRDHFHDDLLAVYYRLDGETILGDAGKYSYSWSQLRRYFTSMPAHNCVFPGEYVERGWSYYGLTLARATSFVDSAGTTRFGAEANHAVFDVQRTVLVPQNGRDIEIVDVVRPADGVNRRARTAVWNWNFGPDVGEVTDKTPADGGPVSLEIVTRAGRRLLFTARFEGPCGEISREIIMGRKNPRCGWYSPEVYVVRPAPALRLEIHLQGTLLCRTRLVSLPAR